MDDGTCENDKIPPIKYEFHDIEQQHLKQVKVMVLSMFPVSYSNSFYKELLTWPLKKIVFDGKNAVGVLCAQIELVDGAEKLYIAILGVSVFWRRRGVGKMLLNLVEDYCRKNESISSIYLHVQKDNDDAREFYSRFGFVITQEIENFYRRTACPTAIIMEKFLRTAGG